ncbi:glycosyltransferase family 32 protein [Prosthecobacter sp.]|uniref:glycosyltransferase family 32 protein n=1 Tax=Prosthecobacter sp. TaxID=1965333 RepID=UPI003784CDAB
MIPNIIHFVFGLSSDFGGRPFSFIHYLAIKTAWECNKPETIFFHYAHEPSGEWWDLAKPFLTLNQIEIPTEIFGNPLMHYAHAADIIRLEVLLEHGGVYLDMDVLTLCSFAPLLRHPSVMARERPGGLCNAVIFAAKGSEFIRRWYDSYTSFRSKGKDEFWSEHSVEVPFQLATENPESVHVLGQRAFFWPTYHQFWMLFGVSSKRSFLERMVGRLMQPVVYFSIKRQAFGLHLYESIWWDRYLRDMTPEKVVAMSSPFGWLFRRYSKSFK